MPRYSAAYFLMMQKLREHKRREARVVAAKGKLRRRKDAMKMQRVRAVEPEPVEQHFALRIRPLAAEPPPQGIIRPDKHRGHRHYEALEQTPLKAKRKRSKPIMVSAMLDFRPDAVPVVDGLVEPELLLPDVYMGLR